MSHLKVLQWSPWEDPSSEVVGFSSTPQRKRWCTILPPLSDHPPPASIKLLHFGVSCYPIAPSATFFTASQGWTFHAGPFSPWLIITVSSPLLPYYSNFKNCIVDSSNNLPVHSVPCLISNKLIFQPSSATHSHGSTPKPRPCHLYSR